MKLIIIIFTTFILADNGCSNAKHQNVSQSDIIIEYSAMSRGFYNLTIITNKTISFQSSRNSKAVSNICSEKEWKILMDLLKDIDLETLPNLGTPTEKRLYDGAAIATLKITHNDSVYQTPSFDHENPNTSIAELVKTIIAITKKQ